MDIWVDIKIDKMRNIFQALSDFQTPDYYWENDGTLWIHVNDFVSKFMQHDYAESLELFNQLSAIVCKISRTVDFFYHIDLRAHSTKFGPWIVFNKLTFQNRPSSSDAAVEYFVLGRMVKQFADIISFQAVQLASILVSASRNFMDAFSNILKRFDMNANEEEVDEDNKKYKKESEPVLQHKMYHDGGKNNISKHVHHVLIHVFAGTHYDTGVEYGNFILNLFAHYDVNLSDLALTPEQRLEIDSAWNEYRVIELGKQVMSLHTDGFLKVNVCMYV
jgi:hypothetical protein